MDKYSHLTAAINFSDIVRTTLGPRGMNKMIIDGEQIVLTNDGATIINSFKNGNPIIDLFKRLARSQELASGDGPQPLHSKVLTPNGFVKMGDLRLGDSICGTNGSIQKVLEIHPKGKKEICLVEFADGRTVECCEDHLWQVWQNCRKKLLTTKQLMDRIGDRYSLFVPVSKASFARRELPIHPYLMGVLLGDGSLSGSGSVEISLGIKKQHVIGKLILPEGIKMNVRFYEAKNYFRVKLVGKSNGKSMRDLLLETGLYGKHSTDKFIPTNYLYNSEENRRLLLAGLSDTDGHITKRGLLEYSTVSEKLYKDVLKLMRGLGKQTFSYLLERKPNSSYSMRSIYRIAELKGYKYGIPIKNIAKTGLFAEMQCIKVSNPDHLYFTDDYVLTHNTTTTTILAGQLLNNALTLLNKGLHPTTIIQGYALARQECVKLINSIKEAPEKEKIIRTSFGTKLTKDIVDKLTSILLNIDTDVNLYKIDNSDPNQTEVFDGYVFDGFTINDRMKSENEGKVAVLDFPINWKMDNFHVTNAEEMEKIQKLDSVYKHEIVNKLSLLGVKWVFYTDTTPEFETYLTDNDISGVVIFKREDVDGICQATKARAISNKDQIDETHLGYAHCRYEKQLVGNKGHIFVKGTNQTLVLRGSTSQVLDEMERSVADVLGLIRHDLSQVTGGGAIEIELSNHLREFAKQVGGKTQLAIEKFADSLESIPLIIAENCGLDAIEILTTLKTLHQENKNLGVDMIEGISDAKLRGVVEPALMKVHAITSATEVANLILKLDNIIQGDLNGNGNKNPVNG